MIINCEITDDDVLAVSDESLFQVVVKDFVFDECSLAALNADANIIASQKNLLNASRMGSKDQKLVQSDSLRGDLTCWITPDLCKDLSLSAMACYVKLMMKTLKPFHKALGLAADYSVQYALYVSFYYVILVFLSAGVEKMKHYLCPNMTASHTTLTAFYH